ncbi:MAG: aldo/keto reductase, partial [Cyanobacteria bacterium P01_A01_bin.68]
MLYREFGQTGWKVSAIGMGTWNIGNQWGNIDETTALATVRSGFDNGINIFDTAESYGVTPGLSEERLGKALQGIRDEGFATTAASPTLAAPSSPLSASRTTRSLKRRDRWPAKVAS